MKQSLTGASIDKDLTALTCQFNKQTHTFIHYNNKLEQNEHMILCTVNKVLK